MSLRAVSLTSEVVLASNSGAGTEANDAFISSLQNLTSDSGLSDRLDRLFHARLSASTAARLFGPQASQSFAMMPHAPETSPSPGAAIPSLTPGGKNRA